MWVPTVRLAVTTLLVSASGLVAAASAPGQAATGLIQFAVFFDSRCPGPVDFDHPCLARPLRVAIRAQAIGSSTPNRSWTARNGLGFISAPAGEYQVWALRPKSKAWRRMD